MTILLRFIVCMLITIHFVSCSAEIITTPKSSETSTTITLQELTHWGPTSTSTLSEVDKASATLHEMFRDGYCDYQDARLLAAAKGLNLNKRLLDGRELVNYLALLPKDRCCFDGEDEGVAYVLGLAFIAERSGGYIPPPRKAAGGTSPLVTQILSLYGLKDPAVADSEFNEKVLPQLTDNETSARLLLSVFHFLPKSCEPFLPSAFDSLVKKVDGVLSLSLHEYPVRHYVANEMVRRLICPKPHARDGL